MPLERQFTSPFQRTDSFDFNEQGRLALANLQLALQGLLQPNEAGVVRGGILTPGVGRIVDVSPTAAFDTSGNLLLVEQPTSTASLAANGSANSRIDLIALVHADQSVGTENRVFVNPANNQTYTADVATKLRSATQVVVTTGTPGASPQKPATPAGHVPLGYVTVAPGTSQLTAGMIEPAHEFARQPVRWLAVASVTSALPYETSRLFSVRTPAGGTTVVSAQVTMPRVAALDVRVSIFDRTANTEVAYGILSRSSETGIGTVNFATVLAGGAVSSSRDLALRIAPNSGSTGSVNFALSNILLKAETR